jgi:hypothetical protein
MDCGVAVGCASGAAAQNRWPSATAKMCAVALLVVAQRLGAGSSGAACRKGADKLILVTEARQGSVKTKGRWFSGRRFGQRKCGFVLGVQDVFPVVRAPRMGLILRTRDGLQLGPKIHLIVLAVFPSLLCAAGFPSPQEHWRVGRERGGKMKSRLPVHGDFCRQPMLPGPWSEA